MQLSFRLDKRPGESHLALDGKKQCCVFAPVFSVHSLAVSVKLLRCRTCHPFFLWLAPVAFRRVALETSEWTSRDSNHHRQSVSAGKTNAIPTEPSGRLCSTFHPKLAHLEARMVFGWDQVSGDEFCTCSEPRRCLPTLLLPSLGRPF